MRTKNTEPWPDEGKLVARCYRDRFSNRWVVLDHEGWVVTSGSAQHCAQYVNEHSGSDKVANPA